ncbi:receptor-type tyrosine-protein phosphatase zeta [Chelonus insularis]|uniref:receptor-type tyrosine-protein phosphatase zeta n=1 Tax=Chelonus insularis TaxID=460826 RepID=UPI001588A9C6|nr:receptor-type tyrosine-protein phosphatase zeta [Chelonus insularis]XP_034943296.1 receptor-type tyrosine-protein phosphatase zeta [Chelonus insularis]XP_034943297.1 receptor-type tyrosine-protein phosphatase zeta [Chelonus insularis]
MTQRMNVGSTKWTGVLLIFFITRLSQSQTTTVSLNQEAINSTEEPVDLQSGNRTILRKADQGVEFVHLAALNDDRERQTPFYSTTTSTIESTPTHDSLSNSTNNQRQLNYEEKQLPVNHEQEKIIKLQKINATKTEKPGKNLENNQTSERKHFFEKLMIHPHSIISEEKRPSSELNMKDDAEELEENFENQEPMTPRSTKDISLLNDTMVNYKKNATNIIEKSKDPKNEIEIIKNPILPKTLRIMQNITDDEEIGEMTEKISDKAEKMINTTEELKDDEKNINLTPKGRTISFGESNSFSSTEEKAIGSTKEHLEVGFTKEVRPYPYLKSPSSSSMNKSLVKESDEIFALENTIGKNSKDEKFILTEPSVVIDNSIQQIKPLNQKRSGNSSRIVVNVSESTIRPTLLKINLNSTFELSDKIKENVNDIPRNDDIRKSTLDLTENGLIDNSDKNVTSSDLLKNTQMSFTESTTEMIKKNENLNETLIKMVDKIKIEEPKVHLTSSNVTEKSAEIKNFPNTTPSNSNSSTLESSISSTTLKIPFESTTTVLPVTDNTPASSSSVPILDKNATISKENWKFNSDGRGFDPETTTLGVVYEFVGLTETTEPSDIIKNVTDNIEINLSSTFPTSSPDMTTPLTNSAINLTTIKIIDDTTVITTLDDNINVTTEFNYSEESVSTTESGFIDTTIIPITSSTNSSDVEPVTTIKEIATISSINVTEEFTPLDNSTDNNTFNSSSSSSLDLPTEVSLETPSTTPETIIIESSTEMTGNELETSTNVLSSLNSSETNDDTKYETSSQRGPTSFTTSPSVEEQTTMVITIPTSTETQEFTPEDVPLLVGIVVEGGWADICPHLPALRKSLADLLTTGMEKIILPIQIVFQKNPCMDNTIMSSRTMELMISTILLYVTDENGNFDPIMTKSLPTLYSKIPFKSNLTIRSLQLVQDGDSGNAIAVVVISCVAFICLVLLASLLFIMRKRQTRFNYGERCRPVSLDAYSLDSVSAYNSVRRKGAARASKRSYGNPTFEDSSAIPSHPLNFVGLSSFCNEQNAIHEEFSNIPQVTARIDELPPGAEVKNRYANVVPLPETRVPLLKINNDPLSEYINASYVRGPKNATKYYIACQAPIESTITDFWRMIWEQQSKVIIMLTDLIENGVEKCAEYIPPSEVTDCHRLYGDYQVTLKKRETKEKYAISTLHLKNLENNTYREISHIWYLWPANGVQTDTAGLIAVILEARALQRGGPGPIVVHCSPGTGRTGTLIALDLGIRQYEITRTVDVPRVVYTIRRDRAGAVQTKEQYAFIYKALNLYATKLAGGGLEST